MCFFLTYSVTCWLEDCNKVWVKFHTDTVEKCENPQCITTLRIEREVRFDDWGRVFCKACYERRNVGKATNIQDSLDIFHKVVVDTIKGGPPLDGFPAFDVEVQRAELWGKPVWSVMTKNTCILGRCTPPVFYTREGIS